MTVRYFVTGTDTSVGKTTIAAALLAAAARRGLRVAAAKPVESGCARDAEGRLRPDDAALLREAAGGDQPLDEVCPFPLEAPLAPAFAAARAGRELDLAAILAAVRRIAEKRPDFMLVEGAGGLLVPLAGNARVADLARELGYPLLLVARAGLGTINHTSLSLEAAAARGLQVAGVILSDGGDAATLAADRAENVAAIERFSGARVLGCLPRLPGASLDRLATAAAEAIDLERLLG